MCRLVRDDVGARFLSIFEELFLAKHTRRCASVMILGTVQISQLDNKDFVLILFKLEGNM